MNIVNTSFTCLNATAFIASVSKSMQRLFTAQHLKTMFQLKLIVATVQGVAFNQVSMVDSVHVVTCYYLWLL